MSWAKSWVRPASVIAAPPILMTTVLPWNSRMYGSASRSVPTSLMSCGVFGVDGHVVVREVGEEDLRLAALAWDGERVLHLVALHSVLELAHLVLGQRHALPRAHDGVALDLEVDDEAALHHLAGGLQNAPVVRVGAVERRLHERRVGDRARDALNVVAIPAHDDPAGPPRTLAVAHDQHRELAHERVERLAQAQLVGALGLNAYAGGAVRLDEHGVAGRELAVHRDAVERALHADARQQVDGGWLELRVGLHEAEHRGVARRDHPGALRLGRQAHE